MIKDLSIFLEFRARENDPLMGDKYKDYISSIFNKIKVRIIIYFIGGIVSCQLLHNSRGVLKLLCYIYKI
jgi:hypothetical protein